MKTKKLIIALILAWMGLACAAQNGWIKVTVSDKATPKESIPFANLILYQQKKQLAVATTDLDGNAWFRNLPAGKYDIKAVYVGYNAEQVNNVEVKEGKVTYLDIRLSNAGVQLDEVMVMEYNAPATDKDTKSGASVARESYQHMAAKNVNSVVSTSAGTYQPDNSTVIYSRGSRNVFVDGERAIGNSSPAPAGFSEKKKARSSYSAPAPAMPPKQQSYNTEEYGSFTEAGFHPVSNQPLSTFGIDVDAASYSNARRMLTQGYLPPKESIRIEEFINYFHYDYPNPKEDEPFSISTEYADCPWAAGHKLLQLGLKGKELDMDKAAPAHIVFLIDVSGSMMDENKLPLLKRGFKLLIKQMRLQDKVSMVVYAGSSGCVLEAESGDHKEKIADALDRLEAGGSTAGGAGIQQAYAVAEKHFLKNGNNRVVLATDGDFNVGVSSQQELQKLIEEKRSLGIYLSVLGFGEGNIKDNIMETLADKGNGNYYYIDNFMEARKVLMSQFSATLYTIAKDVKIQLEFNPAQVKEYRLIGYDNRLLNAEDFNDDRKDAGEIGAGHCVTALYEIIPAGSMENTVNIDPLKYSKISLSGNNELATVKFRYKGVKKEDTTSRLITKTVDAQFHPIGQASANLRLATGVAEFAMLLRESAYKGNSSFSEALELVNNAKGNDADGYVSNLAEMIKVAKELMPAGTVKK